MRATQNFTRFSSTPTRYAGAVIPTRCRSALHQSVDGSALPGRPVFFRAERRLAQNVRSYRPSSSALSRVAFPSACNMQQPLLRRCTSRCICRFRFPSSLRHSRASAEVAQLPLISSAATLRGSQEDTNRVFLRPANARVLGRATNRRSVVASLAQQRLLSDLSVFTAQTHFVACIASRYLTHRPANHLKGSDKSLL